MSGLCETADHTETEKPEKVEKVVSLKTTARPDRRKAKCVRSGAWGQSGSCI